MRDRVPTKPNRYAVYDDNHNFVRYEYHERADEPIEEGTPISKATLLPDNTAQALRLGENPVVKDALEACAVLDGDVADDYGITEDTPLIKDAVDILKSAVLVGGHSMNPILKETTLPSTAYWRSVAYGGDRFITVDSNNTNKAAYSTDGTTWTASTMPSSGTWSTIRYLNDRFMAVKTGTTGALAYSTNGVSWSTANLPANVGWNGIAYGNGTYVTVGQGSNNAASSTNGTNWNNRTLPSTQSWSDVAYGGGVFVAISKGTNACAYSADGTSWTSSTMPSTLNWDSIAYGNGRFVAVNGSGAAYSTNGISWTAITPVPPYVYRITYGNGMFYAINSTNGAGYSTDGINWTAATLPSSGNWEALAYGGGRLVVVATMNKDKVAYSVSNLVLTDVLGNILVEIEV